MIAAHRRFRDTTLAWWSAAAISLAIAATLHTSSSAPGRHMPAFHSGANWRSLVRPTSKGGLVESPRVLHSSATFSSQSNDASIFDKFSEFLGMSQLPEPPVTAFAEGSKEPSKLTGKVVRTAARPFQFSTGGSLPSSRHYTTHKPSLPAVSVTESGVRGDYNHYRTTALKSTPDRAISIMTRDISKFIQSMDNGLFATGNGYKDGDMGENVLVEGLDYGFFKIGQRYKFSQASDEKVTSGAKDLAEKSKKEVIVEITERIEPCGNLCKLQYINNPSITPRERVARCKYFLTALDQKDGLRGWYAKVIQGGVIRVGDSVSALGAVAA